MECVDTSVTNWIYLSVFFVCLSLWPSKKATEAQVAIYYDIVFRNFVFMFEIYSFPINELGAASIDAM